jgi:arginyl-tRNA synthetase
MLKWLYMKKAIDMLQNEGEQYLKSLGVAAGPLVFERADSFEHGHLSTSVALKLSKQLQKSPLSIAEDFAAHLSAKNIGGIKHVEALAPGFVNIFFDTSYINTVAQNVLSEEKNFGSSNDLQGQTWVIEHTSANPNKAMHMGHLRNNLIGMSLRNVLTFCGAKVLTDMVDNNRGIAIAKLMYGFLVVMRKDENTTPDILTWIQNPSFWKTPADEGILPDLFITQCYLVGEKEFKANEDVEKIIRDFVVSFEGGDADVRALSRHVLAFAYQGMNRTLSRLGNHFDKVWHEDQHYEQGKEYIEKGLKLGVFKSLPDGAVLTNLEKYNIPDTILLKRDGTSLYITQDIALTALKKKEYKADRLIWVIGPDQSLALEQLFAVCEQLGIGKLSDFTHVSYGLVGFKAEDGSFKKMSSRLGNVMLIDDLIDNAKDSIVQQFKDQGKELTQERDALAELLALAAIKFSLLKPDKNQNITFSISDAVATKGDSGVYILYTLARIKSILRKANTEGCDIAIKKEDKSGENVSRLFMFFGYAVSRSVADLSSHHVAQYLLDVCGAFNSWYGQEVILDGSASQPHKLAIAKAVSLVIENGLSLLNIVPVEEI